MESTYRLVEDALCRNEYLTAVDMHGACRYVPFEGWKHHRVKVSGNPAVIAKERFLVPL